MSQQAGLPGKISVAALAETTDRAVPVDTHAAHPVDAGSASEPFAANDVVTPLLECLPSHRPHRPGQYRPRPCLPGAAEGKRRT